ncbi:hypothetical protein V22_03990 [Calycomorphotria hydatis]|uniref:Uncharacterized protein n=2 Tax=Calycomorphotria hydatis TaxID=2528027 RepID=A0A517T498_9PLAN|nr:hypothetical protein V22_03990 [Calycomorphotria hydatis]
MNLLLETIQYTFAPVVQMIRREHRAVCEAYLPTHDYRLHRHEDWGQKEFKQVLAQSAVIQAFVLGIFGGGAATGIMLFNFCFICLTCYVVGVIYSFYQAGQLLKVYTGANNEPFEESSFLVPLILWVWMLFMIHMTAGMGLALFIAPIAFLMGPGITLGVLAIFVGVYYIAKIWTSFLIDPAFTPLVPRDESPELHPNNRIPLALKTERGPSIGGAY